MKTLLLLRGLPGSGKSTLAETLLGSLTPEHILSADMFFEDNEGNYNFNPRELPIAHKWCRNQTEYRMNDGVKLIIVANTFTQEWELRAYFELAKKYDYRVHSVIVENTHGSQSIHGVPKEKIQEMKERFLIQL